MAVFKNCVWILKYTSQNLKYGFQYTVRMCQNLIDCCWIVNKVQSFPEYLHSFYFWHMNDNRKEDIRSWYTHKKWVYFCLKVISFEGLCSVYCWWPRYLHDLIGVLKVDWIRGNTWRLWLLCLTHIVLFTLIVMIW